MTNVLSAVLFRLPEVIVLVVGLVLIGTRATGPRRSLGLIGCASLLVSTVLGTAYAYLLPYVVTTLDLPLASPVVSLLALPGVVTGVVGVALLIAAVCVRAPQQIPAGPPPARAR
ncbi:hypothetical protein GGQ54_001901 [Naumannella cuiyingiana]|uniref:Uncharacterized protein n=1 Tax=Naumannella cuiyingiana TaxID=1347891 RepID=A0A7Z0D9P6_9ACTN|nr:hypothetical protein [Naumannella cuiyingiana]NYI71341.1 hypothetical protein [Naumannella cuiyingiana]